MLQRNGRSIFQNPGQFAGSVRGDPGNIYKGGLRNRVADGFDETFSAYPSGYLAPNAFVLPQKAGAIAARELVELTIVASNGDLVPAKPMEASSACSIVATNAQLDQVVQLAGSSACSISATDAALAAAVSMEASSACSISATNATLGGIFSVVASSACAISSTDCEMTALAWIEASAGGPTALSPEGLAAAVWEALATEFNNAGTMGEKLNDAGSAGNPWAALLVDNTTAGTFGERVQKLLTTAKFLGLK